MKRRDFLSVLSGAAAAWPLAALAQQRTVPVIGFLSPIAAANATLFVDAFRQGLKETGFVDGQNVKIEYRWAEGQYDRLPALAAELVKLRVAVIARFRTQRPSHICETSRCRALLKRSSYVTRWRRDWLAGAIGLELANVGIKIPLTPERMIVQKEPAIVAMSASRAIFFQLSRRQTTDAGDRIRNRDEMLPICSLILLGSR